MNEKESGREHTGIAAEMKVLLREPPLLIGILAVFLLFAVFIIYPFVKILLVPTSADWMRAVTDKEFIEVFSHTIFVLCCYGDGYRFRIHFRLRRELHEYAVQAFLSGGGSASYHGAVRCQRSGIHHAFRPPRLYYMGNASFEGGSLRTCRTLGSADYRFFPLAYITISGVLKNISPNLELAAQNLGAKGWYLFRTVTLRLATPGLASAFLLVGINSLADFGNPMLVGGNYHVLATEAYTQVTGAWDLPMGATLSVFLVIPTLIVFFVQRYYLEKNSYVTVTGKPVAGLIRVTAGPAATWCFFTFCMLLSLGILMIIGVVVLFAFTVSFGADYTFTLEYFKEGVINSNVMVNSWVASMSTAAISTVFGIALAFLVLRKKFPGRTVMDFLAMLPVSLPGTFIGLAMILAFNDGPLEMTGTLAIIILGMALRQLPVGYRQAVAGLKQIEGSLEQASTNLGAGSFTTFRKIVLPMLKNSLSVSFVYAFMRSMNTLSTVIFLVSPEWNLASINIMSLANQGFLPTASATAVGIMLVIYLTFGVVKLILRDKINIFDL